ncbi:MAG: aminotransferase class I/II-fold pyridoxal phosphate-dependent enzyme, partial [Thermostichales cyanobacterium SRBZ-1_bins_19]
AVARASRLLVLSYPHNPTTATASLGFWREAVAFCREYDLVLVHDFPYVDWVFDGELPPSVLQADVDKQLSLEFFSLSKSFHMGGFRVGYAIGNAELIQALRQVKAAIDFNQYQGILRGAMVALEQEWEFPQRSLQVYRERRDVAVAALQRIGWSVPTPKATMYLWMPLPAVGWSSMDFCLELVRQTGVALAPGSGFGSQGEGYVRLALVEDPPTLERAIARIGTFLQRASVAVF